jgi:hypothetical protein
MNIILPLNSSLNILNIREGLNTYLSCVEQVESNTDKPNSLEFD